MGTTRDCAMSYVAGMLSGSAPVIMTQGTNPPRRPAFRRERDQGGWTVLSSAAAGSASSGAPKGGIEAGGAPKSGVDGGPSQVRPGRHREAGRGRRRCEADRQLPQARAQETDRKIRRTEKRLMNTKTVTDRTERKKLKRIARKKAAPKAKRASGVARGSMKKKIKRAAQGQRKR